MKINIVVKSGESDTFEIQEESNSKSITVPSFEMDADNKILRNNILRVLNKDELTPTDNVMELFNLFYSVYGADQLVSRSKFGYFSWSRNFIVHLAVQNPEAWRKKK